MDISPRRASALFGLAIAISAFASAGVQIPYFTGMGTAGSYSSASAVSGDGMTVVGSIGSSSGYFQAIRWSPATGIQPLPNLTGGVTRSIASETSYDGSIVIGYAWDDASSRTRPVRWVGGGLPTVVGPPSSTLTGGATGISAQGQIMVGYDGNQGFRNSGGVITLLDPVSHLEALSADGAVAGGYRRIGNNIAEPILWTQAFGMTSLPGFLSTSLSTVTALSDNGAVAVGFSGGRAIRWNSGVLEVLELPAWATSANAGDVSGDGSIVVGNAGSVACLWDGTGAHRVRDMLLEFGLPVQGWQLQGATGISVDGRVIVGTGVNPQGITEGWYAVIPEPSSAMLLAFALVLGSGLRWGETR